MGKHKCQDCGFLTARNRDTRYLDEAEASFRETGTPLKIRNLQTQKHGWPSNTEKDEDFPICFKQIRGLMAEAKATVAPTHARKVLQVITGEKECDYFVDWMQGFTPKEHQEMIDRQWMPDYQEKHRQYHLR